MSSATLARVVLAAGLSVVLSQAAWAQDASKLRLVPFPRKIQLKQGTFALGPGLVLEAPGEIAEILGREIAAEFKRAGLPAPTVKAAPQAARYAAGKAPRYWRLSAKDAKQPLPELPRGKTDEAYALDVGAEAAVCTASGSAGLFYGLQTFCQLVRANRTGNDLPRVTIRDWPALRWRCFQDDLTRGPSSRLATLQREITIGSRMKMNLFTYYMEYQYAFAKHPLIGPKDGSLTPADLKAIVAFGKPRHVDILGNQQSFGHFARILRHAKYAPLRETPGLLCPVKEGSYQLLDDMYSEVVPLLPFEFFNVCCDETWGLGRGPSKDLAKKIGVGGVYVSHIRRVHDLLKDKYRKRMMMWGDIILHHPKNLKDVPTDTIMLTWGYGAGANFEGQIIPFAKSGYEFFICPGVSNWSRILPDFGVATINIRNFVRDGVKHGALGMLNTAWEDDGESINAPKWHGYAWGAECAWTGSATKPEDFNRRVGAVLFGEKGDHFGRAIELLAKTHRLAGMRGMNNRRFWQDDFRPTGSPAAVRSGAAALLAIVRPAIEHLEACRKDAAANAELLDSFILGARRMELIGQRMLDGLAVAEAYARAREASPDEAVKLLTKAETLVRANRDAYEALGKEFKRLWLKESKPYALDWTLNRYKVAVKRCGDLADRIATARRDVKAGKPIAPLGALNPPVGPALPTGQKVLVRRTEPGRIVKEPLQAETPWLAPNATHRFALIVDPGKADRTDLPVEADVTVGKDLAARAIQAFLAAGAAKARAIPAQLDPSAAKGKMRLTCVIPGQLPKGTRATISVYLGLPKDPPALPGAVSTREAPGGMKWLENDKVRLLLGPAGGHVFRWEVKHAAGRDLTMPGKSGWAGFADMARFRGSTHKLACTARGAALVRYTCTDLGSGLVKTISLYAGTSWMEVTLSHPVGHYWDFDNPANFAADGPTPGEYLFSTGKTGPVGRQADGVPAQVKVNGAFWSVKFNTARLALGLVTPDAAAWHHLAPGAGAGGVGIERSAPVSHFVTYAGLLDGKPDVLMNRLRETLSFKEQSHVTLYGIQTR